MTSDGLTTWLQVAIGAAGAVVATATLVLGNFGGRRRVENIKTSQEAFRAATDPLQKAALKLYMDAEARKLGRLYDLDTLRYRLFPWVLTSVIVTTLTGIPWTFFPPPADTLADSILNLVFITSATTTTAGIYLIAIGSVPMRATFRVATTAIRRARRVALMKKADGL